MNLITGATGNVGSELVSQLLELDQPVRVLTRDPRKAAVWGDRVECAVGSFEEPATLASALQGVEQVFLMTNEVGAGHVESGAAGGSTACGLPFFDGRKSSGSSARQVAPGAGRGDSCRRSDLDFFATGKLYV